MSSIYDEDGFFLDDDLRNAQRAFCLLDDYAHSNVPVDKVLNSVFQSLQNYYGEVKSITPEFKECIEMIIGNISEKKIDLSLCSEKTKAKVAKIGKFILCFTISSPFKTLLPTYKNSSQLFTKTFILFLYLRTHSI